MYPSLIHRRSRYRRQARGRRDRSRRVRIKKARATGVTRAPRMDGCFNRWSLRDSQVLEDVKPALARADEVEVAILVDVDGGELQSGAGRTVREVPQGESLAAL